MNSKKVTVIPVHPATNVRSTRNETWLLAENVTYEYLAELDQRRLEEKGKKGTLASRKRQLEITMAHKQEIKDWVMSSGFKMPVGYFAVWFYVPMPASWRKPKIKERIYTVHQSTPDLDNYLKQLYDAIMPRMNKQTGQKGSDDRKIHCYAAFKVWVPHEEACMRIVEYDPDDFNQVFQDGHPAHLKGHH